MYETFQRLSYSYLISDFDYDENIFEIRNSDDLFDVDFPVKHEKVLHYIGKDDNCVVDFLVVVTQRVDCSTGYL